MKGRGDYAAVEGLLTRLSTAGMASIVEDKAGDLKSFGLDSPFMRIVVGLGSSRAALEIGRPEGDSSYARDTSRPLVFTLDKTLTEDLTKPFEQYHKKELFESRAFSMERVKITRRVDGAPKTWEFVKTKGADADKWQVTPEGGQATDADAAKVDALLNATRRAAAGSVCRPTARTGMDAPVLSAAVSYDGGKFERVTSGHRRRSLLRQSRRGAGDRRAGQGCRGRRAPGTGRGPGTAGAGHCSGGTNGEAVRTSEASARSS